MLTEKLHKVGQERDYYRAQWEKLHQAAAMAARSTASNPCLQLNGGAPTDLHMSAGHTTVGGQLDLSLSGTAAAAAAAAAAAQQQHDDYKRDNGYPNNNDLKIGPLR